LPNYEYQCTKCAHIFEIWQNVGEAAPACPECASDVKKVFHPPRVIFKGSGFYVTDLRAEKAGKSGASAGKESDSAPVADKPAESKPADKPAATPSGAASPAAGSGPAAK
jgi:putative FmdB family regulatory protein